jgi:MoaA/NifB/PqqE/SkfB family radical SAM enzyme
VEITHAAPRIPHDFPKIYLEITNVCNLSCSFCPPTRRAAQFMSIDDFESQLGKLAGHGKHLYFHVKGEPLLHPALGDFLAIAGRRGFAVSLTTNGTLVEERAQALLEAGNVRKLSISLHSHSGARDVEAYWRGVEAFLDLHRATRPFPVSLRLWNRGLGGLPPETQRLWELIRARYPGAEAWESAVRGPESMRLDELVYLNEADRFDWPAPALDSGGAEGDRRGFCRGLRNQVAVLVDGSVVPCCLDGDGLMRLGSLKDSSLEEILSSPRARAIYEGFSRRELVEPLCRGCGYRKRFS